LDGQLPGTGLPQSFKDFGVNVEQIPAPGSLDDDGSIGKTVNLFQRETPFLKSAEHDATAFGTEVNGEVVGMGGHGEES
jgi:hypothetical protein